MTTDSEREPYGRTWRRYTVSRRRLLQRASLAGGGLAAALAVACGGGQKQSGRNAAPAGTSAAGGAAAQPKRGGTIANSRWSTQLDRTLDPHTNAASTDGAYRLVYSALLGYDWPTLKLQPELAQKWEQPSPTEYIFTLQPGVKWHNKPPVNGRDMTIDDVVYSLNRARTDDPLFQNRSLLSTMQSIAATDKTTLRITTSSPDAPFLNKIASDGLTMVAPEVVQKAKKFATPDEAVGTGPFMITSHQPGVGDEYVRNPTYWKQGLPYLDKIRGPAIADLQTAYAAFQTGQIDLVLVPGGEVPKYISQHGANYVPPWGPNNGGTSMLQPNTTQKPFNDFRVTYALRLLLDYEELRTQWGNFWYGRARNGLLFCSLQKDWDLAEKEYSNYLPWKQPKDEAIKQGIAMLNAAGFSKDSPLAFTLGFQDTEGAAKAGAQLIQDQWKRFTSGMIDIKLNFVDQATITSVRAKRQFQYLEASNSGNIPDPDAWLTDIYRSGGGRNYAAISDSTLDAMIDKQRTIFDDKQRKDAVRQIIIYMADHSPVTLPFTYDLLSAVNPHVHDYRAEGLNIISGQYEHIWLDT